MLPAIKACTKFEQATLYGCPYAIPAPYSAGMELDAAEADHLNRKLASDIADFMAGWLKTCESQPDLDAVANKLWQFLDGYDFSGLADPAAVEADDGSGFEKITIRLQRSTLTKLRGLRVSHGLSYNRLIRHAVETLARQIG